MKPSGTLGGVISIIGTSARAAHLLAAGKREVTGRPRADRRALRDFPRALKVFSRFDARRP